MIVQTPSGPITVSISRGHPLAAMPRFDSSIVDDVVDRILGAHLPQLRNDAAASAAFARQLEYLYAQVLRAEFPALRATQFIPLDTEVPAGALSYTYRMLTHTGQAKVINTMSADLPKVNLIGKEWQAPVVTTGVSYDFSISDIARSAMANVPFEAMLAEGARFAIEYLGESIAAVGLPAEGVSGLTNAPGLTATTKISTGTWLAQIASIAAATPSAPAAAVAVAQGISMDLQAMKAQTRIATKGLYTADTCLLPSTLYFALEAIPRSPAFTDDNLLDYLRKISGLDIDYWLQLDTASASGHGRIMTYKKDPQVLKLVRPRLFTQLPPQPVNLAYQVPCLAEEGGVNVMRPNAVTYMDGCDA